MVVMISIVLITSCAPPIKQFYYDAYYPQDNIYENKAIGFCITYRGGWNIITDPAEMNKSYRTFARYLQNSGAELLFMGSTLEGLYGTKALAINLNESAHDYAAYIRSINQEEIDHDTTPVPFITEHLTAEKWVYDKAGYRFVEFFFTIDTYDIRLSFWTKPALFDSFLPVFEEIMSSVSFTAGF